MSRGAIEIVRRSVEAFARRDNEETLREYSEDVVWDMSGYSDWPGAATYVGLPAIREFFREWIAPWADWSYAPTELIDAGDRVIVLGRDRGRLEGSAGTLERDIAQVWTVTGGRVVRIANYRTRAEALAAVRKAEHQAAEAQDGTGESVRSAATTAVDIVRAAIRAWNRGDADGAFRFFHEEAEVRSVLARSLQGDDLYRGLDGVREWMRSIADNLRLEIAEQEFVGYGDYVLILGVARGTALSGGPEVRDQYGAVCRVQDGRIILFESHFDHADALISLAGHIRAERPAARD